MNSLRTNPLKEARLNLGMTQSELAELSKLTPNALLKNEQGLYPEPSPKIIAAITSFYEDFETASIKLIADYKAWRMERLEAAKPVFRFKKQVLGLHPTGGVNPFICWRTYLLGISSRIEFCKLLVLHPAVVQKYEQGEMRQMPESIYDALNFVGIEHESLIYLNRLGERYYDLHRHKR